MIQNKENTEIAVNWFMALPVLTRCNLADKYFPEYKEDETDLEDDEILWVYEQEHPDLPTEKMYVICEHLDDHTGYKGQPVTIIEKHPESYFTVQDKDGNKWHCGEEELKEYTPTEKKVTGDKSIEGFTGGEWDAKEGQIYPTETGKTLALIPYYDEDNEEHKANAQLIAAAPDLLAALKEITEMALQWSVKGLTPTIYKAEQAIRKATNQ